MLISGGILPRQLCSGSGNVLSPGAALFDNPPARSTPTRTQSGSTRRSSRDTRAGCAACRDHGCDAGRDRGDSASCRDRRCSAACRGHRHRRRHCAGCDACCGRHYRNHHPVGRNHHPVRPLGWERWWPQRHKQRLRRVRLASHVGKDRRHLPRRSRADRRSIPTTVSPYCSTPSQTHSSTCPHSPRSPLLVRLFKTRVGSNGHRPEGFQRWSPKPKG